jgi:hypothetical protein
MTTTDTNIRALTGISDLRIAFNLVVLTNIFRELWTDNRQDIG